MYERLARSPQHPFSNNAPSCRTLVSENASRFSAVNFYIFPVAVSGSIILAAIMYGKLRDIYSEETQQEQDEKASRQQPPVLDRTTLPTVCHIVCGKTRYLLILYNSIKQRCY